MSRLPLQDITHKPSKNVQRSYPNYGNQTCIHPSMKFSMSPMAPLQDCGYPYGVPTQRMMASQHFHGIHQASYQEKDSKSTKTGRWSTNEDEALKIIIKEVGSTDNWTEIGKRMKTRNSKQCRERWSNYLDPNIKQEEFTEEEDLLIYEGVKKHGRCWGKIAGMLHGRPNNAVKNRFNTFISKKYNFKDDNIDPNGDFDGNGLKEQKQFRTILPRNERTLPTPSNGSYYPLENLQMYNNHTTIKKRHYSEMLTDPYPTPHDYRLKKAISMDEILLEDSNSHMSHETLPEGLTIPAIEESNRMNERMSERMTYDGIRSMSSTATSSHPMEKRDGNKEINKEEESYQECSQQEAYQQEIYHEESQHSNYREESQHSNYQEESQHSNYQEDSQHGNYQEDSQHGNYQDDSQHGNYHPSRHESYQSSYHRNSLSSFENVSHKPFDGNHSNEYSTGKEHLSNPNESNLYDNSGLYCNEEPIDDYAEPPQEPVYNEPSDLSDHYFMNLHNFFSGMDHLDYSIADLYPSE